MMYPTDVREHAISSHVFPVASKEEKIVDALSAASFGNVAAIFDERYVAGDIDDYCE
jgi:hypothetical protein